MLYYTTKLLMILLNKILFFIQTCFICFFVEFFMKIGRKGQTQTKVVHFVATCGPKNRRLFIQISRYNKVATGREKRRERKKRKKNRFPKTIKQSRFAINVCKTKECVPLRKFTFRLSSLHAEKPTGLGSGTFGGLMPKRQARKK